MFCRLRANIPQQVRERLDISIAFEPIELAAAEPSRRVAAAIEEPLYRETQDAVPFLFFQAFKRGISP